MKDRFTKNRTWSITKNFTGDNPIFAPNIKSGLFVFLFFIFVFINSTLAMGPLITNAVYNPSEEGNVYFDLFFSEGVWGDSAQAGPVDSSDFSIKFTQGNSIVAYFEVNELIATDGITELLGGETSVRCKFIYQGSADGTETIRATPASGSSVFNAAGQGMDENQYTQILTMHDDNPTILYVAADALGANNGTSWTNAYTSLTVALAAALPENQVWVKFGTYKPGTLRTDTFNVPAGVALLGGFAGTETRYSQRIPSIDSTILSGDIGVLGTAEDNCYQVVTANDKTAFDSLYITSGYSADEEPYNRGAGMYIPGGLIHIQRCHFSGNRAAMGGSLYVAGTLKGNACLFFTSESRSNGGALYSDGGSVMFDNTIFYHNYAAGSGGALYTTSNHYINLRNCNFYSNIAMDGTSGAAYNNTSSGNYINCIIRDNNGVGNTGLQLSDSSVNIKNCNINGTVSAISGANDQGGCLDFDPGFTNALSPFGLDNIPFTYDDGFMPTISGSIVDAGVSIGPDDDCLGTIRPTGPNYDIGAYEQYDPTNPPVLIQSVKAVPETGAYKSNDVIALAVTFTGMVSVSGGTPRIALEAGSSDRYAQYSSGSNSSVLNFSYTVISGDISPDLAYLSSTALELQGSVITDASGRAVTLKLPVPGQANSLFKTSDIVVDTVLPTIFQANLSQDNSYIDLIFSEQVSGQANDLSPRALDGSDFLVQLTPNGGDAQSVEIAGLKTVSDEILTGSASAVRIYLTFTPTPSGVETISIKPFDGISIFDNALNSMEVAQTAGPVTLNSPSLTGPLVTGITSSSTNGSYGPGSKVLIQISFSATVNVTGVPLLELETGDIDQKAQYLSGSGSATLVFEYQVQTSDSSDDLSYKDTQALSIQTDPQSTIKGITGLDAELTLPAPGQVNSLSYNKDIIVDTRSPSFAQVSASGDNTFISLSFSEPVNGPSNLPLTLSDLTLVFTPSGSGAQNVTASALKTSTGTDVTGPQKDYRVMIVVTGTPGFGDYIKISPSGDNRIFDLSGMAMAASNVTGNIPLSTSGQDDIVVTSVSAAPASGVYGPGQTFEIGVNFSGTVNIISGIPTLLLESGYRDIQAEYTSGSNSSTLVFTATVPAGASASDLDYGSNTALNLQGAVLTGLSGQTVVTTLPEVGSSGSLSANADIVVDTLYPSVLSQVLAPANAYVEIDFSELVAGPKPVSGSARDLVASDFSLTFSASGGTASNVKILSLVKTDGTALTGFNSVIRFMLEIEGLASGVEKIEITPVSSTSIYDIAGNAMPIGQTTGLITLFSNNQVIPIVTAVSSVTANGIYKAGSVIDIAVDFSAQVIYTGTPVLKLGLGQSERLALIKEGSNTSRLVFSITLQAGDNSVDLDYFSASALTVPDGSLTGTGGEPVSLMLPTPGQTGSLSDRADIFVDTRVPVIQSITLGSDNSTATITFSEKIVNYNGMPISKNDFQIVFDSNEGTAGGAVITVLRNLEGNPVTQSVSTVQALLSITGQVSGLERLCILPLDNSVRDLAGNMMTSPDPYNPQSNPDPGTQPDNMPQWVTLSSQSVSAAAITLVQADPSAGLYKAGDDVSIKLKFSSPVIVTGFPKLGLEISPVQRFATYSNGSGTNSLTFVYTVQADDFSELLSNTGAGALDLNSGSIKYQDSASGEQLNATLTLPAANSPLGLASSSNVQIDASKPVITSSYLSEDNSFVDLYFSEKVTNGSGNALTAADLAIDFQANLGTAQSVAITDVIGTDGRTLSGSTDSIRVIISIQGAISGSETIAIGPATTAALKDESANFMATTQSTGVLTLRRNSGTITVTSVSASSKNGFYKEGDIIEFNLVLTGNVIVTGTPELYLETGEYDGNANYVSGSGTSVLVFNYTVLEGHISDDLNYRNVNALVLSNGSITGVHSGFDTLLPDPASVNSIAGTSDVVVDTLVPVIVNAVIGQDNSYVDLLFSEPLVSHDFSTLSADDFSITLSANSGAATSVVISEITDNFDFALIGPSERVRMKLSFNAVPSGPEVINISPTGAGVIIDRSSNSMAASASTGDITVNTPNYDTVKVKSISFTDNSDILLKNTEKAEIKVTFTRGVTVTGTPFITLDTGSSQGQAYYISQLSSKELLFEYTVLIGHTSDDLDYYSIGSLKTSGGTIVDENNISAVLTLPVPNSSTSLSASGSVVVDALMPQIKQIVLARDNSYCELYFTEAVTGPAQAALLPQNFDLEFFKNTGTAGDLTIASLLTSGGAPLTAPAKIVRVNLTVTGSATGDETFRILPSGSASVYDKAGNPMDASQVSQLQNLFTSSLVPDISVVSLDTSSADGIYKEGDTIIVTTAFSGNVTVHGTPKLKLNVNSTLPTHLISENYDETGGYAIYDSGSGTSVLTFIYTVLKDHYSAHLDVMDSYSLKTDQINRIIDSSGGTVNTILPTPSSEGSLSCLSNISIDSFQPFIFNLLVAEDNSRADFTFSENVRPLLGQQLVASDFEVILYKNGGSLESISIQDVVTNQGIAVSDYTTQIVFNLLITGTVSGAESMAIKVKNSDILFDMAGNTVLADTISPYAVMQGTSGTGASILNVTAQPATGEYKAGDIINIFVKYSDVVYISGKPLVLLNADDSAAFASYDSGSGSDILKFNYTVLESHNTGHLECKKGFSFDPAGASILSAGGAAADLSLPDSSMENSLSKNTDIVVDTTKPVYSNLIMGADNSYLEVLFSEPVKNTYLDGDTEKNIVFSDFSLEIETNGGAATTATATSVQTGRGSPLLDNTDSLRILLDFDNFPTGVERIRLKINPPGVISDSAGNIIAADTWTSWYDLNSPNIEVPQILSIGSSYVKKAYKEGDLIDITVAFNKIVTLTGTPRLLLETGSCSPSYADYVIGSSSPTLLFKYTVKAGDDTSLLTYPGRFSLENVNGIITGVNGTADIELPYPGTDLSLSSGSEISIDTESPMIDSAVLSGDNTALKLSFNEKVYAGDGKTLGKDDFIIDFQANGGTVSSASILKIIDENNNDLSEMDMNIGFKTLVFVLDFQGEPSGREAFEIKPVADSVYDISKNRMSVDSTSGWITLNTEPDTGLHIKNIIFISSAGGYGAGETIKISVKFSESILLLGQPRIKLETGDQDRYAEYLEKTSADTIEFSYIVENNDISASLDYHSSAAFELQGGTITAEDSGESADLSLPVPSSSGSLSSSAVIIVDTAVPQFISGQLAADNSYVDILFDSGIYADQYSSSAISAQRFTLIFTKNSGTAENVIISEVKELLPDGTIQAPTPGATRYRLILNVTGDASGQETILIRSRDGYSLFDIAGNPMAPEAGTGTMNLNVVDRVFSVAGTVILNSSSMPDVTVSLVGMTSEITDAQGIFNITGVPAGDYYLVPSKAGYVFEPDRIALTLGPDRTGLSFIASAGVGEVVFGGVIKDSLGTPIPLTQIQIPGKSSVETNDDGRWIKPGMTSGVYTVIPYKENYSFQPMSLQIAADINHLDLDFEATYTGSYYNVSGITSTSKNVPIGDVTVKIEGGTSVQSSSSGEFFVGGLKAGTYIITVSKEGYVFEPTSRTVSLGPSSTGQDFTGTFNASPAGVTARYLKFTYSEFNNPSWFQLNEITIYDSTRSMPGDILPVSQIITSKPTYSGFEKDTLIDGLVEYNQDMAIRDHGGSIVITIDLGSNKNFHTIWHYTDGEYGASGVNISAMAEDDVWKELGSFRASVKSGQPNLDIFQFTNKILINEVKAVEPSYIELVNTGNTTANLRHWSLYHDQGIFSIPDIVLLPGQYVLIHEGAGTNSSGNIYSNTAFSWTNTSSGYAWLVNHAGEGCDFVKWNNSSQTPPTDLFFEGPVITYPEDQKSIGRDKNHVDTDKSSDFFQIVSSPGAVNVVAENIEKYNISGQISDSTSFVMNGVTVRAGEYSAVTDTMGKYTILNVPVGFYSVIPEIEGYIFDPVGISIELQAEIREQLFIGTPIAAPAKYDISGIIYLASGDMDPVSGITVELNLGTLKTKTNLLGRYTFTNLEQGDYTVTPVDPSYNFLPTFKSVTLNQNRLSENFTANRVVQTYTIDGYIKQSDGTGISGVSVEMGSVLGSHEIIQANTSGYFKFEGLKQDYYRIIVAKQYWEFSPSYQDIVDLNENKRLEIFVGSQPEYEISGFVTNMDGQGVEGVSVDVSGTGSVETDAFGSFRKIQVLPGIYTLTPTKGVLTFNPPSRVVYIGPSQSQVNFSAIEDRYTLSGKISITTGGVLQNVKITVSSSVSTTDRVVYTSGLGVFSVENLAAAVHTVTPELAGYTFNPVSVDVTLGPDDTAVDFSATPETFKIGGTLYDHLGAGVKGITVFLGETLTYSDTNGNYTFNNVTSGEYEVKAVSNTYSFEPLAISVRVGPDSVSNNFTGTRAYFLKGRVTDNNGTAVEAAEITVDPGQKVYSDITGNYVVTGLGPGDYRATIKKDGYTFVPSEKSFTVSNSDITQDFTATYLGAIAVICVDQSYTGSVENGSSAKPYKSIEGAILVSDPGTVISVAQGIYDGPVVLPYGVSLKGAGPDKTFIEGNGISRVVQLSNNCILSNICVKGSSYYAGSSGIYCYDSSIEIKNCVITNCYDGFRGIKSYVNMRNVTFSGNYGDSLNLEQATTAWISSSILNRLQFDSNTQVFVSYTDIIQGGTAIGTGTGNIAVDPRFIDSAQHDFTLRSDSPCLNMGDPSADLKDPDFSRNDMGAFGGPGESTLTLTLLTILDVSSSIEEVSGFGKEKLYDSQKIYNSDFAVEYGSKSLILTVDMGKDILTSRLNLYNDGLYGIKSVTLYTSPASNPEAWTKKGDFSDLLYEAGNVITNELIYTATNCRYIRLHVNSAVNTRWIQLNEIEVFGVDPGGIASAKINYNYVISSVDPYPGYGTDMLYNGQKVYNSDFALRHAGQPVTISIDLGAEYDIDRIDIYNDGIYGAGQAGLFFSNQAIDGIYSYSGTYSGLNISDKSVVLNSISPTEDSSSARFVKLVFSDFGDAIYFQINEIEFVGSSASSIPAYKCDIPKIECSQSFWPGFGTSNLVDGKMVYNSDFAVNNPVSPLDISMDLGVTRRISQLRIYNDGLHGAPNVGVWYATAAAPLDWKNLGLSNLAFTDQEAQGNFIPIVPRDLRYIKLRFETFNSASWFQLNEIEVYSSVEVAVSQKITISDVTITRDCIAGMGPDKLNDNSILYNSEFALRYPSGNIEIIADLGSDISITGINHYNDGIYGALGVKISACSQSNYPVFSDITESQNLINISDQPNKNAFTFIQRTARYIKFTYSSYNNSKWFQLCEYEVFGPSPSPSSRPAPMVSATAAYQTTAATSFSNSSENTFFKALKFSKFNKKETIEKETIEKETIEKEMMEKEIIEGSVLKRKIVIKNMADFEFISAFSNIKKDHENIKSSVESPDSLYFKYGLILNIYLLKDFEISFQGITGNFNGENLKHLELTQKYFSAIKALIDNICLIHSHSSVKLCDLEYYGSGAFFQAFTEIRNWCDIIENSLLRQECLKRVDNLESFVSKSLCDNSNIMSCNQLILESEFNVSISKLTRLLQFILENRCLLEDELNHPGYKLDFSQVFNFIINRYSTILNKGN